ncbi:MAG: radical SAM family heme chaperone HemW [Flavobacteriales bacterium]|nr:radical SAM family heme chaperone HemW [Flavobacteriales bacterium]MDW8410242.1 radical SAM family heme chaperone HemW [Flavobacteriales bacterium]
MNLGVYVHVPFCRRACTYCDFYFSTRLANIEEIANCISKEWILRNEEISDCLIATIYFGGGTPSLLSPRHIESILKVLAGTNPIASDCEFTLEANPEDITEKTLEEWLRIGVNRLSIGLQSLHKPSLEWMRRGHSPDEGLQALKKAKAVGFKNISVDFIYALPHLSTDTVAEHLRRIVEEGPTHLSCYELTCEPRTAYAYQVKKGHLQPVPEAIAAEQFLMIKEILEHAGYVHYEISNYALPGFESKHNKRYWLGLPTVGLGPSAVSFNGSVRTYNVRHNTRYIQAIRQGKRLYEEERLTPSHLHNEFVMTRLRLKEGIPLRFYADTFGPRALENLNRVVSHWRPDLYERNTTGLRLTSQGLLLADHLAAELFVD